ncbi:hypothetical protein SAMN00120144_3034 [Hymenobacter roseosalivarius DSM 11622]|uniref:GCN5-related N-acetyltransferase n=1 Tax=Hymenobacter roseosalivarius DSM 11622 TaxID=645990 RepID=A0A1W1ULC9_9BACT|nr:hypothetical protein [Hymenobacter roseosalivarius]SMB81935.1 hypothetical protein SAMN00120144_3034 [Hymenobacter roseosalivarius DSM 11622]
MSLLEVSTVRHRRQFLELPARIYQNHPNWISPLDNDTEAVFDARHNPNFRHGTATRWILTDARGTAIGRVAAFVNEATTQADPTLPTSVIGFFVAYHQYKPVAFFVSLPELNQTFKHVGPRLNLGGKFRFVWEKWCYERRKPRKMFGVIFGVVPAHQGKGVESAMLVHAQRALVEAGHTEIEMNWVGDFNPRMLALTRAIGARISKTHVTYRKLFDPTLQAQHDNEVAKY